MKLRRVSSNKNLLAYIIGLAIGDGNLSSPNGRSTRLRISCDNKYPHLINKIQNALHAALPDNKVGIVRRGGGCTDISSYSNSWENLLGWKVGYGPKHIQRVAIPEWIFGKDEYKISCLRGLIETDGSIYFDRGYPMVMFVTVIEDLAQQVNDIIHQLGFFSRLYTIPAEKLHSKFNAQTIHHVRLSKNVKAFLDLVKPEKF